MKWLERIMGRIQVALWLFSMLWLLGGLWGVVALAQDVAPASAPVTWIDVLLATVKGVFPSVIAFLSGFLTKGISFVLNLTPAPWLGVVSSAVGALGAAMTAATEGLSMEAIQANAVVGAGSGAVGHAVLQSKPIKTSP